MKNVYFLLSCLLACTLAQGQSWTTKPDIPNTAATGRWGAQCFSLGGKIYVGGGYIGNFISRADFWEYDPATDDWTQRASLPDSARHATWCGHTQHLRSLRFAGSIWCLPTRPKAR